MIMMDKWYSGILGGLKLPDICFTAEKKTEKTSPRKLFPTGDRTRARCVWGAHTTACPILVDNENVVESGGYHTRHWIRRSRVQTRRGRWILSERQNPEYDFLRKGSKAVRPFVVDLRYVKEPQAEIRASEKNLSDF